MNDPRTFAGSGWRLAGPLRTAAVFCACIVVVAACSESSKRVSEPLPSSATSHLATTHVVTDPGKLAARHEWLDEGQVFSSALQSGPLEKAVTDLEHGEVTDSGNKSEYPAIIAAMENLAKLPDAMYTRAQEVQGRAYVARIDKFFHLRAIRGCNWPSARKVCWIHPS
jgi:hypothetical protein